jgi:type VI secretion system secreted protein VgrG
MAEVTELAEVAIQVQDEQDPVLFSALTINQRLADTHSFSFIWRVEKEEVSISDHVDFYKKHLGKEISFSVNDNMVFKGIIQLITCCNQFAHNVEYQVTGKGLFMRLDEVPQCRSFIKKTIKDIFNDLKGDLSAKLNPAYTEQLFYTVQYNQTTFAFLSMLAARHGEWLYYDGEQLVLGPPDKTPYELKLEEGQVYDFALSARIQQSPSKIAGFDTYKGEHIASTKEADKPGGSGMIAAAVDASKQYYGNSYESAHFTHAVKKELLESASVLSQQSGASSSIYISGRTYLSGLKLGGTIRVIDEKGNNAGDYIITELQHTCENANSYQNHFVAVPAESAVPPYTNPHLFPVSKPQPALVTDNEDKDGLARIKVRMAWQKEGDSTPWLNVVVPHAGNGKGFRFLPEVDDEVLVNFIDNNAERPFVMGAVYTEKNKSGVPEGGNDVKFIGTRSGRRIIFDDKNKMVLIVDNVFEKDEFNFEQTKDPHNDIALAGGGDSKPYLSLSSNQDEDNWSYLQLTHGEQIKMSLYSGGENIASIELAKDGKKITIQSKGTINLEADGDLNMTAQNIKMTARENIELTAQKKGAFTFTKDLSVTSGEGTSITAGSGLDVSAGGSANVTAGQNLKLAAGAQGTLEAGAITEIKGGLVKIN